MYAKMEYVCVCMYPSKNRIRTLRILEPWLGWSSNVEQRKTFLCTSQVSGCRDCLRNDLCVEWDVKTEIVTITVLLYEFSSNFVQKKAFLK